MGLVEKITKTTEISAIKYKSLKYSDLYLIFRHFSILFIDLIAVHEVLPHNIRHGIDFNLPYQAHRKYAFKIEQSISRSELSISIIINTAWSPVTRDTTDTGLDKLFSQNVTKLETLLDCFLKEIIIVSNFNQLNNRKDLSFEIEAYKLDAVTKYGIIKVCVKNTKQQPIIYSYQY